MYELTTDEAENWNEINPASASRYILWEYKDLDKSLKNYLKKFDIKDIRR